jgi:hypothetical protein
VFDAHEQRASRSGRPVGGGEQFKKLNAHIMKSEHGCEFTGSLAVAAPRVY